MKDEYGQIIGDGYHFKGGQTIFYDWRELEVVDIDIDSSKLTKEEVRTKTVSKDHLTVKKKYEDDFKKEVQDYEIIYDDEGVKVKYLSFEKLVAVYDEQSNISYSQLDKLSISNGKDMQLLVLDKNNHTLKTDYLKTINYVDGSISETMVSNIFVDGVVKKTFDDGKYQLEKKNAIISSANGTLNSAKVSQGKIVCCIGQAVPTSMPTSSNKTFYDKINIELDNGLTYDSNRDNMSIFSLTYGTGTITSGMTGLSNKLTVNGTEYVLPDIPLSVINHSYGSWTTDKAATCTADGSKHRTCSVCGKEEKATITHTGHNYGGWSTIQSADCCHPLIQRHYCQNAGCNHYEDKTGAYGSHSYHWVTAYSDAGRNSSYEVIPGMGVHRGHSASLSAYVCSTCGHVHQIDAGGINWSICNHPENLDYEVYNQYSELYHFLVHVWCPRAGCPNGEVSWFYY